MQPNGGPLNAAKAAPLLSNLMLALLRFSGMLEVVFNNSYILKLHELQVLEPSQNINPALQNFHLTLFF